MTSNSLSTQAGSTSYGTERGIDPTRAAIVRAWRRLGLIASGAVTSVQIARMASTLNDFTDAQLAQIGIERHEIYTHAEMIILTGGKGADLETKQA